MRKTIRYYVLGAGLILMTCLCALMLSMAHKQESMLESSLYEHSAALSDLIVITRTWGFAYNGVFVKKGPGIVSNPYLENPDIVDSNGVVYTKKIPTIITNELSSLAKSSKGVTFHITSLKLVNPNSVPDPWEKAALEEFELRKTEKTGFVDRDGSKIYRLMRPLYIEESCLSCHNNQGLSYTTPEGVSVSAKEQDYQLGDVRGGISVDVEAAGIQGAIRNNYITMIGLLVLLVLVFSVTLYLFVWKVMNRLENQRSQLEQMKKELAKANVRMSEELNIGHEIQMSMLPLIFPPYPDRREFSVHADLYPAREVGGDFYDFHILDDDLFCFCVGDVSGKGVPAALFMAVTKTLIKSRSTDDFSPASILTHVNDELSFENKSCMFVTVFLGILNIKTGELIYANAGHNPPYIMTKSNGIQCLDKGHGVVLGATGNIAYKDYNAKLDSGDMIFVYTDGVTEAMNQEKKLFSEKRLAELLSSREYESTEDAIHSVNASVKKYQGHADQADDITVLAVEYIGQPEGLTIEKVKFVLKNQPSEVNRAIECFDAFSQKHDLEEAVRRQVNTVLDELLHNILSYAYSDDKEHEIELKIELVGNRLTITVVDDGDPFNPFGVETPDTSLSLDEREIGGMGIHLVRSLMDKVFYHRKTNRNVVTLVKHLKADDS